MTHVHALPTDRDDPLRREPRIARMWAVRAHARGGPEQLVYELAPRPRPTSTDVIVRVVAAGITPTELEWGSTYETRDGAPRVPTIPSHEVSGVVDEVGSDVLDVAVGDAVYALTDFWRDGCAAEFVAIRADDVATKPRSLDHVGTASLPLSALTAWQALFDHAALAAGQRALIHGAAGGVGVFAVQLAHWRGAHVIGTAAGRDRAFLLSIGCDEVIDYETERFDDIVRDIDVALDTVGGDTLERTWRVLRRGGALVSIAATPSASEAAERGVNAGTFIVEPSRGELLEIGRLADDGVLRPVVQEVFPLVDARDAYETGIVGHVRGKIVLEV